MATCVFGLGVEPGGMDLDGNHDEVQCPACKGKAGQEAEDREFELASLDWLTMSDFHAFTAGIRQAA